MSATISSTAYPSADTATATTAIDSTALRGAPAAFVPPNQRGTVPSDAIAASRRLAATVLPTRFVNSAPAAIAPTTAGPARPSRRIAVPYAG